MNGSKKLLAIIFVALMTLTAFAAVASTECNGEKIAAEEIDSSAAENVITIDGVTYAISGKDPKSLDVAAIDGNVGKVVIQDTVTIKNVNYPVAYIGLEAGLEIPTGSGQMITSITIGKNVKYICDNAFRACFNLYDFTFEAKSEGGISLGTCCLEFDSPRSNANLIHTIHSYNNWFGNMSSGELDRILGGTAGNVDFDSDIGGGSSGGSGIDPVIAVMAIVVVITIVWCIASNKKH